MTDTPKHSVSVAGIVVDDNERVLVIQRRDNAQWEPPGGVLELSESLEAGTIREVKEETGLEVEIVALSGIYKNMAMGIVSIVFRCTPRAGSIKTSEETKNVRWEHLTEAGQKMNPAFSIRLYDAFRSGVQVRTHDGINLT